MYIFKPLGGDVLPTRSHLLLGPARIQPTRKRALLTWNRDCVNMDSKLMVDRIIIDIGLLWLTVTRVFVVFIGWLLSLLSFKNKVLKLPGKPVQKKTRFESHRYDVRNWKPVLLLPLLWADCCGSESDASLRLQRKGSSHWLSECSAPRSKGPPWVLELLKGPCTPTQPWGAVGRAASFQLVVKANGSDD